ncbi:hypothetical protein ONS95_001094 [Cadophora gregata]|uniref:uncharacterized protein n=1 Tax=Cadophora gregata TaxID=51156 RepID=UPI0026DC7482|nr:uncharacterized protein ONS95_001094 [Cadophora gregata]KAK0129158.1 hypothetical protein ONS95_001094 [Cadophora gregata]
MGGVNPPFLYDPIKTEGPGSPYREFDPKAVTRASYTPKPPRPKHEGPLVNFNQHPDSYLILPYGSSTATPMNPSVKKWIKWMRIIQLVLRCLELLTALGLLALMILIKGVDASTGWVMRIVPGVAILHTVYGAYHLCRKPSGRTPASSASYMLFASFFDVSIAPFYGFSALVAMTRQSGWKTILSNPTLINTFSKCVFYLAAVGGGLHLISLGISIYLAVTFRKITKLPPDMNPLEDHLTTRHKRNKSSVSTVMSSNYSEKRISLPLESKQASGAAYEDLSRPPTIPFFHTRTQSTTSFSTYKSTPPPSRDARSDLPPRQYQAVPSNRSSLAADQLKSTPGSNFSTPPQNQYTPPPSPLKRGPAPYAHEILQSDTSSLRTTTTRNVGAVNEPWFANDSIGRNARTRSSPAKKAQYQRLHQRHDSEEDISIDVATDYGSSYDHPNPLEANPPTPRHITNFNLRENSNSPLSEISSNSHRYGRSVVDRSRNLGMGMGMGMGNVSGDIADITSPELERAKEREREAEQKDLAFKAKHYGELKPGTPPIMIGGSNRQVSSGNYFGNKGGFRVLDRRDVSGKVAEEGRGGNNGGKGWGTRFRKVSGL